jgi:hypothetical protein
LKEQSKSSSGTWLQRRWYYPYQAYILSTLLEQKEKEGKQEEANLIKRISPIAWQNVNLLGRFEFQRQQKTINIQEMISLYVQKIEWQQLKTVKVEP